MNKLFFQTTLILVGILISTSTFSQSAFEEVPQFKNFYDVTKFDIAGIRLGMTFKEAEDAVRSKLNLNDSQITYSKYPRKNPVTNTEEVNYFVAESGDITIRVHMTAAVPADYEHPMRVSLVVYEMPYTPQHMKGMQKLALEKYGKPSNGVRKTDNELTTYTWCDVPAEKQTSGCAHSIGARMKLHPPRLEMTDPRYLAAVVEYVSQAKPSDQEF